MLKEDSIDSLYCAICQKTQFKYKCPRCLVRSCSLDCSKKHKENTGCSGKRDRTAFVSISDFNTATLSSDLQFLQDIHQTVDRAVASSDKTGNNKNIRKLHAAGGIRFKYLRQQCQRRGINLRVMNGLKRHSDNVSKYVFKENTIYWRVDWIIHLPNGDLLLSQMEADERSTLKSLFRQTIGRHKAARVEANLEIESGYKMFIRKHPCPANLPTMIPLNEELSLQDSLRYTTIIEYPDIHVFLKKNDEDNLEGFVPAGFTIESPPLSGLLDDDSQSQLVDDEQVNHTAEVRETALKEFDAALIAQNDPETVKRLADALLSDLF